MSWTRVGSRARCASSANSWRRSSTGTPSKLAVRAATSISNGPHTITAGPSISCGGAAAHARAQAARRYGSRHRHPPRTLEARSSSSPGSCPSTRRGRPMPRCKLARAQRPHAILRGRPRCYDPGQPGAACSTGVERSPIRPDRFPATNPRKSAALYGRSLWHTPGFGGREARHECGLDPRKSSRRSPNPLYSSQL